MNMAVRNIETSRPALTITGQYGIGDCIHQRAIVREMMNTHNVTLQTFYTAMYHDMVADGLNLEIRGQINPRIKDAGNGGAISVAGRLSKFRIGYTPELTRKHGSIVAAQYASVGLKCPERPNFRLPVKREWKKAARTLISKWDTGGKPIMVYRPIVLNKVWEAPARAPDPVAYDALYRSIRDKFFVVSVADLTQKERIVGDEAEVDIKFHEGELSFELLAGLIAEANLVFSHPGFAPILSQAVGTPVICVYGANESYRITNKPGEHLAPTLAIEPITPCEHFTRFCSCDKTIDLEAALPKVKEFAEQHEEQKPRVLIFATTYVDTPERLRLTHQWCDLHRHLNPDCDFLLVDSQSPLGPLTAGHHKDEVEVFSFPDNIGHLSRNGPDGPSSKGRDGWGRAFCEGLNRACWRGYDYVVHIEGDSLFRLPVMDIVRGMKRDGIKVLSVPVEGTKRKEVGWVETGLMFFNVAYLRDIQFTDRYDWPNRTERPTPEKVIFKMLGKDLVMMPWKAERGDKRQITIENVDRLDWVTHCHGQPEIYDRYIESLMGGTRIDAEPVDWDTKSIDWGDKVKLNFGCGTNKMEGWQNFDSEINIERRLPFPDNHADFIFAEHVVEHVDYYKAIAFLKECHRVLKPGGVIRICVPSVENIMERATEDYCAFIHSRKWATENSVRGAMGAILYKHGHKAPWTQSLLRATLFYAGFERISHCEPGASYWPDLKGVEGHGKVIGEHFNWIEAAICEGIASK
jgi:hypothetical protein